MDEKNGDSPQTFSFFVRSISRILLIVLTYAIYQVGTVPIFSNSHKVGKPG